MSSVSAGIIVKTNKYSTSPDLKKVYFNFKKSETQITSFKPLRVFTNKHNYQLSKNFITDYGNGTDGQRETQLFLKGYRIVAGCILIDKKTQKLMLITYGDSHHYHFPKGGVENNELKYAPCESTQNYEGVPLMKYSFMESALRETWEEAGVQGKITKDLGMFYYYNDSVITDKLHQWVNKKQGKFPKSIDYYYEMEVEKVFDEWPDGKLRPRKWFDLQECLDELVSNGRFAQFKAVLNSSLVKDKNSVYNKQFRRDQLALAQKQEYWPRLYNKKYKKVSEEFSGSDVYVSVVVYNDSGHLLVNHGLYGIGLDKVKIEHEPFVWRSSKTFNSIGSKLSYGKLISIQGYEPKNGIRVDEIFDMGTYKKCIHFYSTIMDSKDITEGKWISIEQWAKKHQSDSELFELMNCAVKNSKLKKWPVLQNNKIDVMQLEIDRLKGELTKTKNELVAAKISLSKRQC